MEWVLLLMLSTVALMASGSTGTATRHLFDLSVHPNATCNDGTPSGYYIRKGSVNKYIIALMGGGFCADKRSCLSRPSILTSSKDWPSTTATLGSGLESADCSVNPLFCNWSLVKLAYCTSDLYTGTRGSETSFGFTFRGGYVVRALLEDLGRVLASPEQVVFSGFSAGAVGVLVWNDHVHSHYAGLGVPCRSLSDSGWFGNISTFDARVAPPLVRAAVGLQMWQGAPSLSGACVRGSLADVQCISGPTLYPYLEHKPLIIVDLMDAWVTANVGLPKHRGAKALEYLNYLANNTRHALSAVEEVFAPNCNLHVVSNRAHWDQLSVQGVRLSSAIQRWAAGGPPRRLIDSCTGVNCNPTCK